MPNHQAGNRRWLALSALCLGMLIAAIDTTIVSIALPPIAGDLHIAGTSLSWAVNAYMLSFGGSLLISGRLSDLYGPRRLFLAGIVLFTLASVACGLAHTQVMLFGARALQGVGAAAISAVGLSLMTKQFPDPVERARAFAINGFIQVGGGAVAQLLGGFLVGAWGWRSVFLVNLPICAAVYAMCTKLLPRDKVHHDGIQQLDVAGAVTFTLASTLGVYAIFTATDSGWASVQTAGALAISALLLLSFFLIEARAPAPLVPARIFRASDFVTVSIVGALRSAGALASFVIATLYLQHVLGYDPFHVGLAFVPVTIAMALSSGLAAKRSMRFRVRGQLSVGLLIAAAGLALLGRAPLNGTFVADILPAMLLLGLGNGVSSTPLLLAAMNGVDTRDSGVGSGILNTACLMGGALGLAAFLGLASAHTNSLQQAGTEAISALNEGYHLALLISAIFTVIAAAVSALALHPSSQQDSAEALQEADMPQPTTRFSE